MDNKFLDNNFLENASKIVDAALALKKSMEQHGYVFHDGSFEPAPEGETHQYCYCHTTPEEILPHVDHSLAFSAGQFYQFRGIDEDGDYCVICVMNGKETDRIFSAEDFHMCFRMATPKECEQAESGKAIVCNYAESGKAITVRDYIEHLKTLDQDRNIWVSYDFPCSMFAPIPDTTATEQEYEVFSHIGVKEGDYIISAF